MLWIGENPAQPNELQVGFAGQPDWWCRMAWSPFPGNRATRFRILQLDLRTAVIFHDSNLPADGKVEFSLPILAAMSGSTLHLQGLQNNGGEGSFTRMTTFLVP